jgi:hypothetical protein
MVFVPSQRRGNMSTSIIRQVISELRRANPYRVDATHTQEWAKTLEDELDSQNVDSVIWAKEEYDFTDPDSSYQHPSY